MNARIIPSSAMALAAILVASTAFAQGGPARRGRGGRGMGLGPRIEGQLDLSEEQRARIRQLRAEARQESSAARQDLGELRSEVRQLWQADHPSAGAILAAQQRMDALRRVIQARQTELRMDIRGILTADQRARLSELAAERPGRGGGRHGRMGRRGRGMAQGGPGMAGPGRGGMMAERLGLREDQQAQVQALRQQAREATADERAALQQIRQALRAEWSSGQPDEGAIDGLQERAAAARSAIRAQQVRTRIAILDVLDADQRAALHQLQAERHERRATRRGRGPGRGLAE